LNWLNSEKNKDKKSLTKEKEFFARELLSMKKEDLFKERKKLSLWQRLKIMIWGK
jgi:hypothetical protein